jgi:predicted ATPase
MMSDGRSHTNAATADLLILPAYDRVRAIRSERWVSYPRVQKVTRILEQVLDHPRTTRMPSIAIFGDSGMGKTMLMQKFCADHPSGFDAESEQYKTRVLALQMTSRPGERRFYAQILDALGELAS